MKITLDLIKSYNPCPSGIENFENKYPGYNNSLVHLLELPDISYPDKIWLATKVLDKMTLVQWSVECAEMVVDNYNKEFPTDNRINETIQTVKDYINGKCDETAASLAARSAWSARSAARSAESAARSAAESAAWSAAESAESAAWSAARSAARSAESAAESAWSARSAKRDQENINLSILIALVDNMESK